MAKKALAKHKIETLKDFTEKIEELLPLSEDRILWYRGSGSTDYTLAPSLHRHPSITNNEELLELEGKIIDRFNQRSVPYVSTNFIKEWEILFYIQHFGIPSRLLDWTENPFVALYFALTSAVTKRVKGETVYATDVNVWVLDPVLWNRAVLSDNTYTGGILSLESKHLTAYEPRTSFELMKNDPVCMFGTYNSARIVAQRGVFSVFGKNRKPMETVAIEGGFNPNTLQCFYIEIKDIEPLLTSLISIGITDSVIFPDLSGLATELKRFFKFRV
ncbi:FRG domain-containing protein [Hymenobacter volaticus]|uniref:FRG domain-containing protein n=1 Tax=Hymenobacter volaticus TaxID=2932254 RepID=A0ABY4GDP6_9BACT|nr:FRG domain-containing protein [Hymenobacter volaticus]UOQ69036.1 FRG domain-containing protein [Hymenobacter volaticus]